jgi:hypothetical protein
MTDHLAQQKLIGTGGGKAKFGQTGIRTQIDSIQLGSRAAWFLLAIKQHNVN